MSVEAWVAIGFSVLMSIISAVRQFASTKNNTDEGQNIEIMSLKEKSRAFEQRLSAAEGMIKAQDTKMFNELEKVDRKLDKLTDLIMSIINK